MASFVGSLPGFSPFSHDSVPQIISGFIANCELEWVKIQLKDRKELLIGSFYMPHQNMEDVKKLEKSLNVVSNKKNIILTGDFNWSVTTISWSDIPGALFDDFMSDEFVLSTISSRLLPLVGCSCVHNDIIAVENPELVTNCELEWIETWKTSKS
jgi:hypothetical protein